MSHFTVLVIGDDVEGQLAPYDEGIAVEPYREEYDPREDLNRALDFYRKQAAEPAKEAEGGFDRGHDPEPYKKALARYEEIKTTVDPLHAELWFLNEWNGGGLKIEDGKIVRYSTYNPKSEWDWYQIGGRWNGFFDLRPDEEPLIPVEPHYSEIEAEQRWRPSYADHVEAMKMHGKDPMTKEDWDKAQERNRAPYATREDFMNAKRGTGDQVRKNQIDWEFAREKARVQAEEQYDKFAEATKGIEPGPSWKTVLTKHGTENIDAARKEFNEHPFNVAAKEHVGWFGDIHEDYYVGDPNARMKFVQAAVDAVYVPYAVVIEGEWISKGKMGWWGMSSDEVDQATWNRKVREMLDDLPGDTMLTLVDCHI